MTTTAPISFGEVNLSDPNEMMKVTNNGKVALEWAGSNRRIYTLPINATEFVPFHVVCKYMGDPRAIKGTPQAYITPEKERGLIPPLGDELRRLTVFYGIYQSETRNLPKHAPKVTITTLSDIPIQFPIQGSDFTRPAGFTAKDERMTDVRSELIRLQNQIDNLSTHKEELARYGDAIDLEAGDPMIDSPPSP